MKFLLDLRIIYPNFVKLNRSLLDVTHTFLTNKKTRMKKIFTLMAVAAFAFSASAANLLTNGDFETWSGGLPTGWVVGTTATATQVTDTYGSALSLANATATTYVTQEVACEAGKTYTIKLKYKILGGDGTDFRIWANFFKLSGTTQLWSPMTLADSLALKGPGGNTTTAYFPNELNVWKEYTYETVAPAGFDKFSFQVRMYKAATVIMDDFVFEEKVGSSINNPSLSNIKVFVSGNVLNVIGANNGAKVDIYSALGTKVKSTTVENGVVTLDNISKGIYVVRIGKESVRFVF